MLKHVNSDMLWLLQDLCDAVNAVNRGLVRYAGRSPPLHQWSLIRVLGLVLLQDVSQGRSSSHDWRAVQEVILVDWRANIQTPQSIHRWWRRPLFLIDVKAVLPVIPERSSLSDRKKSGTYVSEVRDTSFEIARPGRDVQVGRAAETGHRSSETCRSLAIVVN